MEEGVFPGGVVVIRHRGEVVLEEAFGYSHLYDTRDARTPYPTRATTDTIYDLASLTKLFTATCVMQLVEEGRLELDAPVASYLPEFAEHGKADRTIRQLLTHVAGLPPFEHLWELEPTPEARVRHTLAVRPQAPANTEYVYSDVGLITLGHLVGLLDGGLDRSVRERVARSLGLRDLGYCPPEELRSRIAPTEDESYAGRGMVWGQVHDENAWSLGGVAGHAGLFGTAREVSALGQLYLNRGEYEGARLLRPETVEEMTRNQIPGLGSRGLGWQLDAEFYMGELASDRTYGHTGFTGTSLVVDPRRELVVTLLTNRVHPTRHGPDTGPARRAVANAAREYADSVTS